MSPKNMPKKIYRGKINSFSFLIQKEVKPLPEIDPLTWLKNQIEYPQILWVPTSKKSWIAAAGSVLDFFKLPDVEGFSNLLFFIGGSSHEKRFPWENFPETHFFLPKMRLCYQRGKLKLETYTVLFSDQPTVQFSSPVFSNPTTHTPEIPNRITWDKTVAKALQKIRTRCFYKVVTARIKQLEQKAHPFDVLQKMMRSPARHTVFLYRPSQESAFIGMTPEMLFEKKGLAITTEAIAATRKRLRNPHENKHQEEALHKDPKDLLEFGIVKETLDNLLSPYCDARAWLPQDKVLKTPTLLHLYNRLEAHMNQDMSPKALIELLHPTPSITGFPKKEAAKFIKDHESFARGWYAAPIGWIGSKNAQIAVAIRSLLLTDQTTTFFSATGIVEGSLAEKEWQELNDKIAFLTEML